MAEIIRSGVISVPPGQLEAAQSVGMTRGRAMRTIVYPQALRVIIPPTGNQFIMLLKASSMVAVIGGGDSADEGAADLRPELARSSRCCWSSRSGTSCSSGSPRSARASRSAGSRGAPERRSPRPPRSSESQEHDRTARADGERAQAIRVRARAEGDRPRDRRGGGALSDRRVRIGARARCCGASTTWRRPTRASSRSARTYVGRVVKDGRLHRGERAGRSPRSAAPSVWRSSTSTSSGTSPRSRTSRSASAPCLA